MALIRWYDRGPAESFDWLQRQINDLFDLPRSPERQGVFERTSSPAVDVVEHSDRFVVECDLPGVDRQDLDITMASEVLTIKGEKKPYRSGDKAKVYKNEAWEGSFQRTLSLPPGVDPDKVEAAYKDGVLTVTVPKKDEAKARRIELKAR